MICEIANIFTCFLLSVLRILTRIIVHDDLSPFAACL